LSGGGAAENSLTFWQKSGLFYACRRQDCGKQYGGNQAVLSAQGGLTKIFYPTAQPWLIATGCFIEVGCAREVVYN